MNTLFAAGLFDNPWLVAVIVIGGALVNWLSNRRAGKQPSDQPEGEAPSVPSGKAPGEFNLEDALRRLMGEPPPAPVPPRIPRADRSELQPEPDWQEEEPFQPVRQTVPPLQPPLIAVAPASFTTTALSEQEEEAARRFEQFNEQGRHPATVIGHRRGYGSGAGRRTRSRWRDPRSARRAFVASLVFGPPKGLEP